MEDSRNHPPGPGTLWKVLESILEVLELFDGQVDREVEHVKGQSLQQTECVVKSCTNSQVRTNRCSAHKKTRGYSKVVTNFELSYEVYFYKQLCNNTGMGLGYLLLLRSHSIMGLDYLLLLLSHSVSGLGYLLFLSSHSVTGLVHGLGYLLLLHSHSAMGLGYLLLLRSSRSRT